MESFNMNKSSLHHSSAWNATYNMTSGIVTSDVGNTEYSNSLTVIGSVERHYILVILILGFPGNLASIVTILKMSRLKSSTFCVAALSVVDNVALILKTIFMELLHQPNAFSVAGCRFMCFFGLVTAAFSNWILVAVATERFMAVRFPLKVASIWTLRRTVFLVCLIFSCLCVLHLHIFWTIVNSVNGCDYSADYRDFTTEYWYWISASVYAFIPCTVLIMFNFLIVYSIQQSSKVRRHLAMNSSSSNKAQRSGSGSHDNHITIMLVTVTIMFVILTIPRCVVMLVIKAGPPQSPLDHVQRRLLDVLTSMFADSNHAVNFYLYFFAGRQFRYQFLKTMFGRRRDNNNSIATNRSTLAREEEMIVMTRDRYSHPNDL
ncbi:G-protein coupled receptor dmsr-1-like [Haliotis rubra]|uniref:G-protein coupled receptor dmsr-1-like n=1 Tax=Haliotis rubra TaxID=36100 RepID=UPI001EE53840|nr:G-protein coupled receptor dmsr-1-like [Haliotis rubra]